MRLVVHNDAALCCVLAVSENGSSWRNVLKPTDLYWRRSQCFYKCAICAVGTSVCLFIVVAVNVYVCVAPLTGFPAVCRLCLAGCYFISFSFYFLYFFLVYLLLFVIDFTADNSSSKSSCGSRIRAANNTNTSTANSQPVTTLLQHQRNVAPKLTLSHIHSFFMCENLLDCVLAVCLLTYHLLRFRFDRSMAPHYAAYFGMLKNNPAVSSDKNLWILKHVFTTSIIFYWNKH